MRCQGTADRGDRGPRSVSSSSPNASTTGRSTATNWAVMPWSHLPLGEVPGRPYTVALGTRPVRRAGADLTVLAYGTMVRRRGGGGCGTGIDAEIVDSARCSARPRHDRARSRQAAASSRGDADLGVRRRAVAWCRSAASTIWRRRSPGSPAGTGRIRMRRMGLLPGPAASASWCSNAALESEGMAEQCHQVVRCRRRRG